MPGLAKTDAFMLGTATVMIGAQSDLFDLNPIDDSIGLVKNFSISSEPTYTELTQGVKNTIVMSVMTANPVRCSMEVYEYNVKNLAYGLGLDGSSLTPYSVASTLSAQTAASGTSLVLQTGGGTGFAANDMILIMADTEDHFYVRKVASKSTDTLTMDKSVPRAIPVGSSVRKVNTIDIGSKTEQPFLSAKVVGKAANGDPIVLHLPKLRISKGFTMAFGSENYGNLPFEFSIYDLVSTDPNYSDFGPIPAKIYRQ